MFKKINNTLVLQATLVYSFLLLSLVAFGQPGDLGKVLVNAETMPAWGNCNQAENPGMCTETELRKYIQKQLKYPKSAIEDKVEGVVIISCVVSRSGKVVNPRIMADIGGGCGEEAMRIVSNMPLWNPAQNEGEAVSVIYNIEIPFEHRGSNMVSKNSDIVYQEPVKPMLSQVDPRKNKGSVLSGEEKQLLPADYEETGIGRVYTRATQMPYFPGCERLKDKSKDKRKCSNGRLVDYLSAYLAYPEEAKSKSIEGIVHVSFIIDEKGSLIEPEIIRDIGGGCGAEALRVLSTMPNWEPGKDKGKPVKTKMSLPIRFFLSAGASGKYRVHWGALRGDKITEQQLINALTEDLIVRNIFGDDVTILSLNVLSEKGNSVKEENSNGEITLDIMRFLRKVKTGTKLILTATVQDDGELVDVFRVFKIVKA